jgi:hypothetical protein
MKLKFIRLFFKVLFLALPGISMAQIKDTVIVPKISAWIVPVTFIHYGGVSFVGKNAFRNLDLTTKDELREDHPAHVDNYLQILSTKPAYIIYLELTRLIVGKENVGYNFVPSYQQHSFGLAFNETF